MKHKRKKGFTLIELLAVIVILAIILIIAIPAIGNIIKNSKENTYMETTKMLEEASKLYIAKNPDKVPKNIGDTTEVSIKNLLDNNLLDSVPKDARTGQSLDTNSIITITKIGDKSYTYEYNKETVQVLLTSKFASNVGSEGIYELKNNGASNEAYFFSGVNPNNWIEFGESGGEPLMWRIIKNNEEGIKIIYEGVRTVDNSIPIQNGRITIAGSTSFRWNDNGFNKWEDATLKTQLATWYNSIDVDEKNIYPIKWCSGASGQFTGFSTTPVSITHFMATECVDATYPAFGTFFGKTADVTGYGMIRVSDYLSTTSSNICTGSYYYLENYNRDCGVTNGVSTNFLYKSSYSWWTQIAWGSTSTNAWSIRSTGEANTASTTAFIYVRPVLNLKSDIIYKNGAGTLASPYIVE